MKVGTAHAFPTLRSSEDVLSGKKFASGMALQKSPDEQDIKAILPNISNIESKSSDGKYANYEVIITLGLDYRN